MANRVSNEQLEELLDFLIEHPAIAKGVGLGVRSKETIEKQWNALAVKLNSHGTGSSKSGERWKKYWADLKHKSKSRLAKWRRDALGTGSGPNRQDDLSEIDQKILAIIGEHAVFGDIEHRVPLFNPDTVTVSAPIVIPEKTKGPICQEIVIPSDNNSLAENTPIMVNSPSRRGNTNAVYTLTTADSASTSAMQQIPEPIEGAESPVSRPLIDRPRVKRSRPSQANPTRSSRIDPEWIVEIERSRVEAENRLANASMIMAEASRVQADASLVMAQNLGVLIELIQRQSDDIRALLETRRPDT